MGRRFYWMMLASLVALSGTSHSQEFTGKFTGYYCTVRSAFEVRNGVLSPSAPKGRFVGQSFLVERSTGKIAGSLFEPDRWEVDRVLDFGSDAQSFKVIFVTPKQVRARLLVVDEYQKGVIKEFVLMDNLDMYAGECEHEKLKLRRVK